MQSKGKWKLFGKITIADIVIILVLLLSASGIIYKLKTPQAVKLDKIKMEFYVDSVPEYAAKNVKAGDNIIESSDGNQIGTVLDKVVDEAELFKPDSEGKYVKTSQEGYNSITIIAEIAAKYEENRFISNEKEYDLGKTYGIKVGNELFYARVRSVEKE